MGTQGTRGVLAALQLHSGPPGDSPWLVSGANCRGSRRRQSWPLCHEGSSRVSHRLAQPESLLCVSQIGNSQKRETATSPVFPRGKQVHGRQHPIFFTGIASNSEEPSPAFPMLAPIPPRSPLKSCSHGRLQMDLRGQVTKLQGWLQLDTPLHTSVCSPLPCTHPSARHPPAHNPLQSSP